MADENEVWKCPKHPSKRSRNGICPTCLRDRLVILCPECATIRPCPCAVSTTSSSSSSSSSFSRQPSLRRSRSVAIPFLRSEGTSTPFFLSLLKRSQTKRRDETMKEEKKDEIIGNGGENFDKFEDFARMVTRSRSVTTSGFRRADVSSSRSKTKFWPFPSPLKAFRSTKTPKIVVHDR